jgi:hypothetical protein
LDGWFISNVGRVEGDFLLLMILHSRFFAMTLRLEAGTSNDVSRG